ncbi:unnamed protein product [Schistosoma margrebowiei]|uniref:Vinculin n=1 Tax=Schistosoma margrebowiei TaxID=48269 RepID=A0A183MTF2_9TREM|nr:unnamed protein product [Schistosoma margrebowiei]
MAALMAQLSQIVRGEYGTKKDLINVSMAIAEASLDVNQCAKVLAKECTDRRIRSVSCLSTHRGYLNVLDSITGGKEETVVHY